MITQFQNTEHRLVSAKVLEALKTLSDELDLDFTTEGGTIGSTSGLIKLRVALRDKVGSASLAKREWDIYAGMIGLKKEDFGQVFYCQRVGYRVSGHKAHAPKFNVLAERISDKRTFKFPADTVRRGMVARAA